MRPHRPLVAQPGARPPALRRPARTTAPPPPRAAAADPAPPVFWVDFEVRDSELDQYNVVNNAVYAVYFQHVRHKFLAHVGLPADAAAADGGALALAEQTIRFRAPLRSGDVFRGGLGVRPGGGGARVVIDQYLERADGARVADGVATVVSLDASYRPRRVPVTVRAALESGEAVGEGEGWV